MERRGQSTISIPEVPKPAGGRDRAETWPGEVSSPAKRPPANREDLPGSLRLAADRTSPAAGVFSDQGWTLTWNGYRPLPGVSSTVKLSSPL